MFSDISGNHYKHPKFVMLSAHDNQITNLWQTLDPIHFQQDNFDDKYEDWYSVPYASFIQIELHKLNDCEDDNNRPTGKCWRVMFTSNGQPLKFKNLWKKDEQIS